MYNMKKVFLIGADGMLGGELKERLEKNYEVVGTTIETLLSKKTPPET